MTKDLHDISDLTLDPDNANEGTERGRYMVDASLRDVGAGRSIVVDANGVVLAGNKTLEVAEEIGLPIKVVRTSGEALVVVQREDLDTLSGDDRARLLAYYDNRASEINLSWNAEQLASDVEDGVDLSALWSSGELEQGGVPDTQPRSDGSVPVRCPECGHEFVPGRCDS